MRILAIETSCDDTGIAILEVNKNGKFKVLANIVASQIEIHKKYGGVFPAMAKREHQNNLVPTFEKALIEASLLIPKKTEKILEDKILKTILEREPGLYKQLISFLQKYEKPDIDYIAVTNGPGLEPCLWVGVNFARAISHCWNIPIIPVNHIESHILVNFLDNSSIKFPAIALIVSGGHTQIILVNKIGKYKIIGETRDDAAGECFDKCAKILGLEYPGGPVISKMAEGIKPQNTLPRPMIGTKDYDFSFSGLKTAVLYADKKIENKSLEYKKQMSAEVQQAIIDVLIKKTIKAVKDFKVKTLVLGGGVSANQKLKDDFKNKLAKELPNVEFITPKPVMSTDNGLMVAITGYFTHLRQGFGGRGKKSKITNWQDLEAKANLRVE
jgi:N6-L-threonylcarbamoyladenine synthase